MAQFLLPVTHGDCTSCCHQHPGDIHTVVLVPCCMANPRVPGAAQLCAFVRTRAVSVFPRLHRPERNRPS